VHAKLLAIRGPLRMSVFRVADRVSIGCGEGNEIRLADGAVSERHCTIAFEDGRFVLRDLESRAGTLVNGIPIKEREVTKGDEITAARRKQSRRARGKRGCRGPVEAAAL